MRRHSSIRPKRPEWLCIQENVILIQMNADLGRKSLYVLQDRRHWGPQALLPRVRGAVEADDRPAPRFSRVLVPVPRPHSASGGSVSCRCARLPGMGFSEAPAPTVLRP